MDGRFNPTLISNEVPATELGLKPGKNNENGLYRADYGHSLSVYLKYIGEEDGYLSELGRESHIASTIILDRLDTNAPDMMYDELYDRIIIEDLGDVTPFEDLSPDRYDDIDTGSCVDAYIVKALLGDADTGRNVVVDDDGECYPIDFDNAGSRLIGNRHLSNQYSYDEQLQAVQENAEKALNTDVDTEYIEERITSMLTGFPFRGANNAMQRSRYLPDTTRREYLGNILKLYTAGDDDESSLKQYDLF